MGAYTNLSNIPLSVAVWLANDDYEHDTRSNHISVTGLLKSTRQIVLGTRVPKDEGLTDIESLIPSSLGTSIHQGIEDAWLKGYKTSLEKLNVPQRVIDRVRLNPKPEDLTDDIIPIYLEQRTEKEINGFIISGKYDFVGEGRLEDFKSTSTYSYMAGNKDADYILQGSIYRWLNPTIITQDRMSIQYIFTDWSAMRAKLEKDKGYPPKRLHEKPLDLMTIPATENWIKNKLSEVTKYINAADAQIPECNDEELWRKPPQYKYYKNPQKMTRSTKNFTNIHEANLRLAQDGGVGTVSTIPGTVNACKYCPAFEVCLQKDKYITSGELNLY